MLPSIGNASDHGAFEPRPPLRRRILLVDDCEEILKILADALRSSGSLVETATDGIQALALAEELRPQLAVLDLRLPRLGGWEVARRLRARFGRAIFLAALTGWGAPGDRQRSMTAGFDRHLTKPTPLREIRALADEAMSRGGK